MSEMGRLKNASRSVRRRAKHPRTDCAAGFTVGRPAAWLAPLTVLGFLLAAAPASVAAAAPPIRVNAKTSILVAASEPGPVQKAAADLANDLRSVFGRAPAIVHSPADARGVVLWIADRGDLPAGVTRPAGWEKLGIYAVPHSAASGASAAVVLTGSDMRGTIYAIYQFSQQFLGVDPLYWWDDNPPRPRAAVSVPGDFSLTDGPAFKYRGFFINDEDLLTGWRTGIPDGGDISLPVWNRVFEAILRLKGDLVIPGTWIFPYEPQIKAAGERGLVVSQHHVNVLGLDTYRWPKDQPYSFTNSPKIFESALRTAMNQYPKGLDVVWSVGYRGQNDYPFWLVDKNAPATAAGRAAVIQSAIGDELQILRSEHPDAPVILNAWQEASRFLHQGLLHVPAGVTLVWPDDGHGVIQDAGEIKAGEGVYYHTAMIDGRSNHFTEGVPLETIRHELGRAAAAGATAYLVVNTSNLRPVPMSSRATMEIAWNPKPWTQTATDEADVYLNRWNTEEFGRDAAPLVDRYYRAYSAAPAHYGPQPDARMGDAYYESTSRRLLLAMIHHQLARPFPARFARFFNGAGNLRAMAARQIAPLREADGRWAKAQALAVQAAPRVSPRRRPFYQANILTQVAIGLHSNRMLLAVTRATQTDDSAARLRLIQQAVAEGRAVEAAMRAADYGKWKGFYTEGDWLLDVPLTIHLAAAYARSLQGAPMDQNVVIRAEDGGFAYSMITAYQGNQKVQITPNPADQ